MDINFLWGILAGAVIILTAFLVPAIQQAKRTAKAVEELAQSVNESLNPLIRSLREATDITNQVAGKIDRSLSNVQHLTDAVGEAGDIIGNINRLLKHVGTFASITTSSFGAGIKTALGVFVQGLFRKGEKK
ncbi:MAG: DUF948 domain-containing protein [Nitrospirae bacterium]|nr:DUF948 domain-containing protein [Nitrospirota bacterium]